MINSKGQTMLELVFGVGLITVVVGAMTIVTINTLRNTQFSENQTQATKLAQENLEKVRTIKNSNFFICLQNQIYPNCSTWQDIWNTNFGTTTSGCTIGCTFVIENNPANCPVTTSGTTPFCLKYNAAKANSGRFTYQIIIEDEADLQKRITSRAFWNDSISAGTTGAEHSSDLVTIMSRY